MTSDSPEPNSTLPAITAVELASQQHDRDLAERLEIGMRSSMDKVVAQTPRVRSAFEQLWDKLVAWFSRTLPGIWTRELLTEVVPVDLRDIRQEDMLAILRAVQAGATRFSALEAELAKFVIKAGSASPPAAHGLAYRRSDFCDFRKSARLRYAWYFLVEIRAVAMHGKPEFEPEVNSARVQSAVNRLVVWGESHCGGFGRSVADFGRRILVWETSFAKTRPQARLSLDASGVGAAILADPGFWFQSGLLPVTESQKSKLWETWVYFVGSLSAFGWSMVSVVTVRTFPPHVRPALLFASECALFVAMLLCVRVAPMFGSFWSELITLSFRKRPTIESRRAEYERREKLREKRRKGDFTGGAGDQLWEFSRRGELDRLRTDAPVVVLGSREREELAASNVPVPGPPAPVSSISNSDVNTAVNGTPGLHAST